MGRVLQWWSNDLSRWVKFVLLVLLANGLPAFLILMTLPGMTDILFVWTIRPEINARLIGVMYSNALLLVAFAALQTSWARVRVNMVIITLFSVLATLLTFVYLDPFLAHPWYHLAYWLTMYLILFFAAPVIFILQERKHGGRLPIEIPLGCSGRLLAAIALIFSLITGVGLLFQIDLVNQIWPWTMPPLVGGLIGVLFITHTAAYAWAIWDGDWLRVRPMFWQAPPTALLFLLLPLVHYSQIRTGTAAALGFFLYWMVAGFFAISSAALIVYFRAAEKKLAPNVP